MYEGVVPPSNKPPNTADPKNRQSISSRLKKVADLLIREYESRFGRYRDDNHSSSPLGLFIGKKIVTRRTAKGFNVQGGSVLERRCFTQ